MDDQLIGKIVVTIAIGTPTAYWIGRIFADIIKGRLIYWANQAGYQRGYDDGERHGFARAIRLGKWDAAEEAAKRIECRILHAIEQETTDETD